ncbi:Poly (ADP-ribose) polymerase [Mactra antiquata]
MAVLIHAYYEFCNSSKTNKYKRIVFYTLNANINVLHALDGLPFNIELNDTLKLHVEIGSIESQQVDVIAHTTAHFPEMGSALSRALLGEGGKEIQEECRRKGHTDFMAGNIVKTSGGKLRCKRIYHVLIDAKWDRQTGQERIYQVVQKCLVEASHSRYGSISFPTIGTGSNNYPPDKVADNMVRAVCDFAKNNPKSSIRHVHIVIFYADISIEKVSVNQIIDNLSKVVGKGRPAGRRLQYVKTSSHTDADDVVLVKVITNGEIGKVIRNFHMEIDDLYDDRLVSYKDLKQLSESEELKKDTGTAEEEIRLMLTLTFPKMRMQHEMGEHIAATVEWHYEISITLPSDWDIAREGTKAKVVSLKKNCAEYENVKEAFFAAGCPVKRIVDIKRIEVEYRWFQYMTKKKHMEQYNPKHVTNERKVWHGTHVDTVDKIVRGGYDRSFRGKNAVTYGDGVYFAVSSAYSHGYTTVNQKGVRQMFYNRVLTGEYCQETVGMGVLPVKDTKNGYNIFYDSAVNDVNNPDMYMSYFMTHKYTQNIL